MAIDSELQEKFSSSQSPSSVPQSRPWILVRLAVIVSSLGIGGRLMWFALKNDPSNPPGLSPFIAFAVAVIILIYDDMADQQQTIFRKSLTKRMKTPKTAKPASHKDHINAIQEDVDSGTVAGETGSNADLLRQLQELREENQRLKMMYANLSLENQSLKERLDSDSDTEAGKGTESS